MSTGAMTIDQFINSPFIGALVGVIGLAAIAVISASIGLYVKVATISRDVTEAKNMVGTLANDPDVVRWSTIARLRETGLDVLRQERGDE